MAPDDKYQDGETYRDASKDTGPVYSLDDPTKIVQDLVKELASVRKEVTPVELIGIVKSLKEHPLDDKKG
jgi:hypothetical protein